MARPKADKSLEKELGIKEVESPKDPATQALDETENHELPNTARITTEERSGSENDNGGSKIVASSELLG